MSLTITIILFFSGAGIITVAFIRDWYNKKKWGWYKTLLITGFAALAAGGTYDLIHAYLELIADSEATRESVVQTPPVADTAVRQQPGFALLQIPEPMISKSGKGDSVKLNFEISNSGNASAFRIHSEVTYGHLKRGKVYLDPVNSSMNEDTTLVVGPAGRLGKVLESAITYRGFISRTSFVCIQLNYTDSARANNKLVRLFGIRSKPLSLYELSPEDAGIIKGVLENSVLALAK